MAKEEDEPTNRGFKVQDRRRFSASGDTLEPDAEPSERPRPAEPAAESAPPQSAAPESAAPRVDQAAHQAAHEAYEARPRGGGEADINFSTFVLSLSTQALAHLGEIPDPMDNAMRVDLAAARQFIDLLAMLQEKTAGNLDRSEAEILEQALYDLRMRFVDHSHRR